MGGAFSQIELDGDGFFTAAEHARCLEAGRRPPAFFAIKPGQGNLTEQKLWNINTGISDVPTPLVYQNTLYMLRDNGILASLNPQTGKIVKQARLPSAASTYYASPVAGDGKIYLASVGGHVVVLKSGPDWEVLKVNEFSEPIFATPAVIGRDLLIRTKSTLFCFRNQE